MNNVPDGATIESSSGHVPRWERLPGVNVRHIAAPQLSPRARSFKQLLADNPLAADRIKDIEPDNSAWYSVNKLLQRDPDYVAINSLFYHEFMSGQAAQNFPEVVQFYNDLLNEKTPYRIIFDRETEPAPWWAYPKDMDFLKSHITIFERADQTNR